MPIQALGLTHTYMPDTPFQATAIADVDLQIDDGEFIGLIGHTGSGKSTLVQHFNALLRPTSGTLRVDDIDITEKGADMRAIRRRVGLVFQYPEYQLFEETAAKDVAFGPKNLGLSQEEIDKRVRKAFEMVHMDYDEMAERSPFEMSGGQKRRLAVAGVLAMDPQVLVLDEPVAGLDPKGRDEVLELMRQWHADGKTIVMVSHSMDDVAKLATRILVMNKGKLAMQGKPARCSCMPRSFGRWGWMFLYPPSL